MNEEKEKMMLHCPACHGAVFQVFKVFAIGDDGTMAFYGTECGTCGTMKDVNLSSVFAREAGEAVLQ